MPSKYLVSRDRIVVTQQDVLLMFTQSSTAGRPFTKLVRLPYEDIAGVGMSTSKSASWLSMGSRQANISYMLAFAPDDSIRVAQLVRLISQRAPTARGPR
jgi:hypothetical protein